MQCLPVRARVLKARREKDLHDADVRPSSMLVEQMSVSDESWLFRACSSCCLRILSVGPSACFGPFWSDVLVV